MSKSEKEEKVKKVDEGKIGNPTTQAIEIADKYSNLTKIEQLWITKRNSKLGDAGSGVKASPFTNWVVSSINNNNTRFVRYLHIKSAETGNNAFKVVPGQLNYDGE